MLTNLLWIMKEEHYQRYLKEFTSNKELKNFLMNVFVVFTEIVKNGIFLKDWIVIIVLGNRCESQVFGAMLLLLFCFFVRETLVQITQIAGFMLEICP